MPGNTAVLLLPAKVIYLDHKLKEQPIYDAGPTVLPRADKLCNHRNDPRLSPLAIECVIINSATVTDDKLVIEPWGWPVSE